MYKKFSLEEIFSIKTNFFNNLKNIYTSRKYTYLKEFLKDITKEGDDIFYFESNEPIFRISKNDDGYTFVDEKEKIQLNLYDKDIDSLHNKLKDNKKINKDINSNKTIFKSLMDDFVNGDLSYINNKPFLVYDIETLGNINDLNSIQFMLGYSIVSNDDHNKSFKYKLVSENNLVKFVDYILNFDGWVVGYNNIYFDNPVVINSAGYGDAELKQINDKSIDLFLFILHLTGKKMSLDKVSQSLVSVGKTLSSGLEGEEYLKKYLETGDSSYFNKVKSYCKNDVKMTLGILLYFMNNNNIFLNEKEYDYSLGDLINLSNYQKEDKLENGNLFGSF